MRTYPKLMAAAIGLAAAVGGSALASSAAGSGPADRAVGSATAPFPTPAGPGSVELEVQALSGPAGENPSGFVHAAGTFTGEPNGAFELEGPVTCVRVEGNKAAIKYRFDKATGVAAPFKGGGIEVFVEDNGTEPSANGQGAPQMAAEFAAGATQCDDPALAPFNTVRAGHYNVTDGEG
jgi:hypothetical protein